MVQLRYWVVREVDQIKCEDTTKVKLSLEPVDTGVEEG